MMITTTTTRTITMILLLLILQLLLLLLLRLIVMIMIIGSRRDRHSRGAPPHFGPDYDACPKMLDGHATLGGAYSA